MRLDNQVVVADFDGGKIILIVDPSKILDGCLMKARDLNGYGEYLVEFDLGGYNGKTKETYLDYYLERKYLEFEVVKDLYLEPLYLNKTIMDKYNLEYGDEVSNTLLSKLEDEINKQEEKEIKNKIVRR